MHTLVIEFKFYYYRRDPRDGLQHSLHGKKRRQLDGKEKAALSLLYRINMMVNDKNLFLEDE